MSVSVSSPAQLHVNTHFWECVPVVCKQSGSPGRPGSPFHCPLCQDGCRGWSAACAMHRCGSQGNSLRSVWNLCPLHGFVLVSFEKQMLLGVA